MIRKVRKYPPNTKKWPKIAIFGYKFVFFPGNLDYEFKKFISALLFGQKAYIQVVPTTSRDILSQKPKVLTEIKNR